MMEKNDDDFDRDGFEKNLEEFAQGKSNLATFRFLATEDEADKMRKISDGLEGSGRKVLIVGGAGNIYPYADALLMALGKKHNVEIIHIDDTQKIDELPIVERELIKPFIIENNRIGGDDIIFIEKKTKDKHHVPRKIGDVRGRMGGRR